MGSDLESSGLQVTAGEDRPRRREAPGPSAVREAVRKAAREAVREAVREAARAGPRRGTEARVPGAVACEARVRPQALPRAPPRETRTAGTMAAALRCACRTCRIRRYDGRMRLLPPRPRGPSADTLRYASATAWHAIRPGAALPDGKGQADILLRRPRRHHPANRHSGAARPQPPRRQDPGRGHSARRTPVAGTPMTRSGHRHPGADGAARPERAPLSGTRRPEVPARRRGYSAARR
ncbi:hypothetical protein GA0115234_1042296 [Streptomyces sp. DvalAA-43]|nr:hypothetical protein GA0115234_1042296 [Streptomyces sp. DvalAA-43]